MKERAFTLAEVLIALVIIGVIAAITVPTIIANSKRSETSGRLKKFYSTLTQSATRAYALGDSWEIWCEEASKDYDTSTRTTSEFANTHLLPHLSVSKTGVENGKYTIYLSDGTNFYITKEQCLHFFFDSNGGKAPNKSGRDQYRYTYCPDSVDRSIIDAQTGVLIAYPWQAGKTRSEALKACKNNPDTCSKLLLMDQWEFKKDYPHHI